MGEVRGSARIAAATLVMMMVTIMPLLFHYCEAAPATYTVGGAKGWTLGNVSRNWAAYKKFKVGDTLVFKYDAKKHNLVIVSMEDYGRCNTKTKGSVIKPESGKSTVTVTPGHQYFICTIPLHCQYGMKMRIYGNKA